MAQFYKVWDTPVLSYQVALADRLGFQSESFSASRGLRILVYGFLACLVDWYFFKRVI